MEQHCILCIYLNRHATPDSNPPLHRTTMQSATYTLFRNAILGEQQVVCLYDGRVRELCPHIIGIN